MDKFQAWLKDYGKLKLARKLGVSPSAVTAWFQRRAHPKIEHCESIIRISRGKIRLSDIIGGDSV